jgi:hypothetical protein
MGDMPNSYTVLIGEPQGKKNLPDIDVDGRVILKNGIELAQDKVQW